MSRKWTAFGDGNVPVNYNPAEHRCTLGNQSTVHTCPPWMAHRSIRCGMTSCLLPPPPRCCLHSRHGPIGVQRRISIGLRVSKLHKQLPQSFRLKIWTAQQTCVQTIRTCPERWLPEPQMSNTRNRPLKCDFVAFFLWELAWRVLVGISASFSAKGLSRNFAEGLKTALYIQNLPGIEKQPEFAEYLWGWSGIVEDFYHRNISTQRLKSRLQAYLEEIRY